MLDARKLSEAFRSAMLAVRLGNTPKFPISCEIKGFGGAHVGLAARLGRQRLSMPLLAGLPPAILSYLLR